MLVLVAVLSFLAVLLGATLFAGTLVAELILSTKVGDLAKVKDSNSDNSWQSQPNGMTFCPCCLSPIRVRIFRARPGPLAARAAGYRLRLTSQMAAPTTRTITATIAPTLVMLYVKSADTDWGASMRRDAWSAPVLMLLVHPANE